MSRPRSAFGLLTESLSGLGTIWIFVLMLLINADVAGRYFLNRPIIGVTEIVSLSIVGIVFLQLGQALRVERFIRSDVLLGPLLLRRPRLGYLVQGVHHAIGALLLAAVVWYCVPKVIEAWRGDEYVGTEGVFILLVWPIEALVVVGAAVTLVQFLLHAWRDLRVASGALPAP